MDPWIHGSMHPCIHASMYPRIHAPVDSCTHASAGSEREIATAAQPLRRVSGGGVGRVGGGRDSMTRRSPGPRRGASAPRGGSRGGRGGRGGGGRAKEPEKSKEDFDAEMDAYMSTKAA